MGKKKWLSSILMLASLVFFVFPLTAQEEPATKETNTTDIADLDLSDLLNSEVVVAGKKSQAISESPGIISVITSEDLNRLGIINLADVFSYIPGFTVSDNYWTREIVTAREIFQALYNDKILLLLDGIPAYEAINTEYYLDLIPIEAIKRIEVIRGPGSTLYGTNAFAGVINIITKHGEDLGGVEFKTVGGSYSLFERTISIGKKYGDFDCFFAGNIRTDDGYVHLIPRDEGGEKNLRQSYRKEFSRAHLNIGYKDFTFSMQLLEYEFDHFGMVPFAWAQGASKHHTANFNLSFAREISNKVSTRNSIRVMRQVRDNEAGTFGLGTRVDGKPAQAPTFIDWKSVIYQLESQWNYNISTKLSLVSGFTIEKRDPYNITTMYDGWGLNEEERIVGGEGSYVYPPEKNKIDWGVYGQADWKIKRFDFVGGLRYTYMGVAKKSFISPRAAMIFNVSKNLNLKALYGMAFRSPTIYETEAYVLNVLYGGKTNIKPEKVSSLEFALDYVGKRVGLRANYYYMTIDDIIARRGLNDAEKIILGTTRGVIYDNVANQKIYGVEMEIKSFISKKFDFFLNGSWRSGKDRNTSKELNYLAKILFSGGLNLKLPTLQAEISPNFYYVGSRHGLANDGNIYRFDPYFIFNLRVGLKLLNNLEIDLIGKNLLDKKYYFPEMTRNKNGLQLPGNSPASIFIQVSYLFL